MKEYDRAGLAAPKARRADSIIPPPQVAINQETTNHLAEIHNDIATVKDEMQSVMSMVQSQRSVPPIIPVKTPNSNTSAITLDRTQDK